MILCGNYLLQKDFNFEYDLCRLQFARGVRLIGFNIWDFLLRMFSFLVHFVFTQKIHQVSCLKKAVHCMFSYDLDLTFDQYLMTLTWELWQRYPWNCICFWKEKIVHKNRKIFVRILVKRNKCRDFNKTIECFSQRSSYLRTDDSWGIRFCRRHLRIHAGHHPAFLVLHSLGSRIDAFGQEDYRKCSCFAKM